MYQGPPPAQSYNDFIMQQELHQRLNYGPTGGIHFHRMKDLLLSNLDLSFAMHHEMNSGPSSTVPDSSGADSEDLQPRFSATSPPTSQVISSRGSAFNDHSWN
jgi:hypothetical protein